MISTLHHVLNAKLASYVDLFMLFMFFTQNMRAYSCLCYCLLQILITIPGSLLYSLGQPSLLSRAAFTLLVVRHLICSRSNHLTNHAFRICLLFMFSLIQHDYDNLVRLCLVHPLSVNTGQYCMFFLIIVFVLLNYCFCCTFSVLYAVR